MITELQFNHALQTVIQFRNQTNEAYYASVFEINKNTTCANWAKKHPNMSYRLKGILIYNCPKVKVLKMTSDIRKVTRGFGPKMWMEYCSLTGKNNF